MHKKDTKTYTVSKDKFLNSLDNRNKLIAKDKILVKEKELIKLEHDQQLEESEKILKSGGMVQKQQTCQGLQPFFSVSPMNTKYYYAAGNTEPTIDARLYFYGGYMGGLYTPYHLSDFCTNDRYVIGRNASSLTDESDLTDIKAQIRHRCAIQLMFYGYFYPVGKQMLLIFGFGRNQNEPINMQFFINTDFIFSQPIYGTSDHVALIVDLPEGSIDFDVYARVAASNDWYTATVYGMHGYLI